MRLPEGASRWASVPPPAPLRTCFRISPPDGEAGGQGWRVEFLLQASDDPSLLVPASDVWRVKGRLASLARFLDDPHERLLESSNTAICVGGPTSGSSGPTGSHLTE